MKKLLAIVVLGLLSACATDVAVIDTKNNNTTQINILKKTADYLIVDKKIGRAHV